MKEKGFTIIELLVVMGIFLAVSAVLGGIIFSVFRGSEKTATLDQVRQNGDYAISLMARDIRNTAKLTSTCSPSMSTISVETTDRRTVTFACNAPTSLTANGVPITNDKVSVRSCSFACTPSPNQPPTVRIRFTLNEAGGVTFVEKKASVDFETSVTLRNP